MYIRRKVYSAVEDENGEIRYFSTNEIISEEEYLENLYSEDYLDDDDMERLFSDDDTWSAGKKAAVIGGSTAAGIGLAVLGHKAGKKISASTAEKLRNGHEVSKGRKALATLFEKEQGLVSKAELKGEQAKRWMKGKFENAGEIMKAKKAGILSEEQAKKAAEALEAEKAAKAEKARKEAEALAQKKLEAKAQAAYDGVMNEAAHAQTMEGIPVKTHRNAKGRYTSRRGGRKK